MRAAKWWHHSFVFALISAFTAPLWAVDEVPVKTTIAKEAKPAKEAKTEGEQESLFVRIRRNERGKAVALETAVIQFEIPGGDGKPSQKVDLIGAIHVGEKTYYDELNQRFANYDALLFELVAPEDFRVPEGEKLESQSGVGAIQTSLKSFLGLEFQLDCVDYSKPNFVHADMSPEQFQKTMRERGESFLQMMLRLMGQGMAMQGKNQSATDAQLIVALLRRDRAALKRVLAEQMEDMEDSLDAIAAADGSSTIITERNKKALQVLRRELDAGKQKVGIFYGAGHLSDMQERLLNEFGARRVEEQWLTAWDLTTDHSKRARP